MKKLTLILFSFCAVLSSLSAKDNDSFKEFIVKSLNEIAKETSLPKSEILNAAITDAFTDEHSGITHIYLQQMFKELPVYKTQLQLHFDRSGDLLIVHNQFVQNLVSVQKKKNETVKIEQAIKLAAKHLNLKGEDKLRTKKDLKRIKNTGAKVVFKANSIVEKPINTEKVYVKSEDGKSVSVAWRMDLADKHTPDWWDVTISAETGELLSKENYTFYCTFHNSYETKSEHLKHAPSTNTASASISGNVAAPANSYNVFALPVESPIHGNQSIVTEPWSDAPNASPIGWHNDDNIAYTYLRGNNVYATEDTLNTDTLGYSPTDGTLSFDYTYLQNAEPNDNVEASITNIFYWSNLMHDVWYQYGFDEESGNFQNSNFGKGGKENDFIYADALDGSGTNNANFSSPPDGNNGRMQMFEWGGSISENIEISTPISLAETYITGGANFGGTLPIPPQAITGELVLALDGSTTPTEVCDSIINGNNIIGKIAIIDRGNCFFVDKVLRAQQSGAIACIICNNVNGSPSSMGGTNDSITIPALMIRKTDCDLIKAELMNNVQIIANLSDNGTFVNYDSGFDNGIVCHEYGHGISTRLTGGASVNCLSNAEQMGEGWSDWFGLIMTIEAGDSGLDRRGVGTYVSGEDEQGNGIRLAPYSTSFAENSFTYDDLCGTPVPHGVGFVWGTMLWDLTWRFINEFGFDADLYNGTGGNNKIMQLVIDAMKLQPCNPGFVDARDAILFADQINNNGANQRLIWEVFANRGLGFSANQGSNNDICDGTGAYDLPLEFQDILKVSMQVNKTEALTGDTIKYTFFVKNDDTVNQTNVVVTDTLPDGVFFNETITNQNITQNGNTISYTINSLANKEADTCVISTITETDIFTHLAMFDDVETMNLNWIFPLDSLNSSTFLVNDSLVKSGDYSWFAENIDTQSNQIMSIDIGSLKENAYLSFWHLFNTETNWDGGVVEVSTDNQTTWVDLEPYFISNGYNGNIETNQSSAISGQPAFTGKVMSFINSIADLSSFANAPFFHLRFRFASDSYVGGDGWYIDDIKVFSGKYLKNTAYAISNETNTINSNTVSTSITPATDGKIRVNLLLEAYYDTTTNFMRSVLFEQNIPPMSQPFNVSPWNYYGNESLTLADQFWLADVADWVLIQLRSKQDSTIVVEQKACLLREDGVVLDANGNVGVSFLSNQNADGFYLSVIHRSHLPIITNQLIYANQSLDFINNNWLIKSPFVSTLNNGNKALFAGDFHQNGLINNEDYNQWSQANSLLGAYVNWDADGNGIVNVLDFNWWNKNKSKVGELRF